ncbi:hypothetical protein JB92DRAFT_728246 [Gautieria morchelliformis]|nr:hypothetical protein JB92DRAFT_728246 [Gautieria morchelliformis]
MRGIEGMKRIAKPRKNLHRAMSAPSTQIMMYLASIFSLALLFLVGTASGSDPIPGILPGEPVTCPPGKIKSWPYRSPQVCVLEITTAALTVKCAARLNPVSSR